MTLMALPLALSRKVPLEGVVESSSRSKARTISSASISAELMLRGSEERVVRFSRLRLEKEGRSLPARSWMALLFWLPARSR